MGGGAMALTPEFGETSVDDLRMPHYDTVFIHPLTLFPAPSQLRRPAYDPKEERKRPTTCAVDLLVSCHTPRAMIIVALAALFLTLPMSAFLLRAGASAVSDTFYMLSEGPYLDVTDMREAIQEEGGGGGLRGCDLRLRCACAGCERGSTV
ncbi:hypothetical protein CABS01_01093 [Colletotrichum abscissum]|uniref:uncharacterized protein n=1 Tax=Colletotrichum abscissum TaxID=1671311 RepID=UPI0027D54414|nr:uncharacterized protein CABS01_01093 [Colletotrichum abscissum]KAK1505625.1 hypothetical protein CABS01_01093 [Colletotrichum abscissum]